MLVSDYCKKNLIDLDEMTAKILIEVIMKELSGSPYNIDPLYHYTAFIGIANIPDDILKILFDRVDKYKKNAAFI